MNKFSQKLYSIAFFRRRGVEKIRLLRAKIDLQKDFVFEYEKSMIDKTKKRIQEYADSLEYKMAEAIILSDFDTFKANQLAVESQKLAKKDSLSLRAFRESSKRKGIFTDQLLEAKKDELQKLTQAKLDEFSQNLDLQFKQLQEKNKNSPSLDELREQNKELIEKFEQLAWKKSNKKLEKTKQKAQQRIENNTLKIEKITQPLKQTDSAVQVEQLDQNTVIKVDGLCMYFGGVKAVDGLSFDVKKGEIFGLIGPNGAGKTTVFNCITQFYKPVKGEIFYRGFGGETVKLNDYSVHDVAPLGIVRTFQNLEVIKEISVLDNLLVAAHRMFTTGIFSHVLRTSLFRQEETAIKARAMKTLEFMGISQYAYFPAFGLPYGVLKKIEIARTLMNKPQLIILDEPAAGLNDTETAELSKLIKKIAKEYDCTILLVEHDMGLVMEICDRILAISFGKQLAIGTAKQIQQNKDVQTAYLGIADEEGE